MVGIGIVGIGFMGVTHFKAINKVKGGKVTAIFTRDEKKLGGDWRQVQGNFGGSGGRQDLRGIATHSSIDGLLTDSRVDLIDICLPTPMHEEWTLKALAAGKHVLLEKPIALDIKAAARMIAAAKKHRLHFMVAHVLRYFPEFKLIKDLVESGTHGPVLAAHFKRVISRPAWWSPKLIGRTGGPAIDLHIHDADFVQYLFGMPTAVSATGYVGRGKTVEHQTTAYHFAGKARSVTAQAGWLSQRGCSFEHGYDIYFERATVKFNSSWGQPPVLLSHDGKRRKLRVSSVDGFVGELQEAVDAVRHNRPSQILSAKSARDSLRLCLLEIRSVKSGRKVRV